MINCLNSLNKIQLILVVLGIGDVKPISPANNQDDGDDINIDKFSDEFINKTLSKQNITKKKEVNGLFKIVILWCKIKVNIILCYSQAACKFSIA